MGERSDNRAAADRLAKRIVEHSKATGRPVSASEAQRVAADTARREDRRREIDPPKPKGRGSVQATHREVRAVYRIDPRSKFDKE